MPYSPRETLAATLFLVRLNHLHELRDRDKRRRFRQADSDAATAEFYGLFNIQPGTPETAVIQLARWIVNPMAHTYVPAIAGVRFGRCIVGQSLHLRCGLPQRDPRHISPVIPALADLGTPVLVDVEVTETAEGIRFEGRRP